MGLFHFLKKKHSSDQARDRLKLLLVSDRADCSPEILEMIRRDLVQVISRYVEIDTEELEIQITQIKDRNGKNMVPVLFANIPIRGGSCSHRQVSLTGIPGFPAAEPQMSELLKYFVMNEK